MKTNKTNKHSTDNDIDSNTGPNKKAGVYPAALEGYAIPVSYKVPTVLLNINPITTLYELQYVFMILW